MTATPPATFNYNNSPLNAFTIDGVPCFIANEVCAILGLANVGRALMPLDDDEKGSITTSNGTSGNPTRAYVTEAGLYSLVLRSRKPEAKAFKRWVTHDVLPQIRQTGSYTAPAPTPELTEAELIAKALVAATNILTETTAKLEVTTEQLAIAAPKAELYDEWLNVEDEITLDDAAKYLSGNPVLIAAGVHTGPKLLRETLQDWKWIYKPGGRVKGNTSHLRPVQQKSNDGLIYLRPGKDYWHAGRNERVKGNPVLVVSRKGLEKIYDRFLNDAPRALFDTDDLTTN